MVHQTHAKNRVGVSSMEDPRVDGPVSKNCGNIDFFAPYSAESSQLVWHARPYSPQHGHRT